MKLTRQQKTTLKKLKETAKEGKITDSHLTDILTFFGLMLNSSDKVDKLTKDVDLVFQFLVNGNPVFYVIIEEGEISAKEGDFQFGDVIIDITEKAALSRIISQKSTFAKEHEKEKLVFKEAPKAGKSKIQVKKIVEIMTVLFTDFFKLLEEYEIK